MRKDNGYNLLKRVAQRRLLIENPELRTTLYVSKGGDVLPCPEIQGGHSPDFAINTWVFKNDDGKPGSWKTASLESNISLPENETARLRVAIDEVGGVDVDIYGIRVYLYYRLNGGTWNNIGSSEPVSGVTSQYITDGDATSQEIGSGTFRAGVYCTSSPSNQFTILANEQTEVVFNWELDPALLSGGDTIELGIEVYNQDDNITYSFLPVSPSPTITVLSFTNSSILAWTEGFTWPESSIPAYMEGATQFNQIAEGGFTGMEGSQADGAIYRRPNDPDYDLVFAAKNNYGANDYLEIHGTSGNDIESWSLIAEYTNHEIYNLVAIMGYDEKFHFFYRYYTTQTNIWTLSYDFSQSQWSSEVQLNTLNAAGEAPAVCIDGNGDFHVWWNRSGSTYDEIYYTNNIGGTWQSEVKIAGEGTTLHDTGYFTFGYEVARPVITKDGYPAILVRGDRGQGDNSLYYLEASKANPTLESDWSGTQLENELTGTLNKLIDFTVDAEGNFIAFCLTDDYTYTKNKLEYITRDKNDSITTWSGYTLWYIYGSSDIYTRYGFIFIVKPGEAWFFVGRPGSTAYYWRYLVYYHLKSYGAEPDEVTLADIGEDSGGSVGETITCTLEPHIFFTEQGYWGAGSPDALRDNPSHIELCYYQDANLDGISDGAYFHRINLPQIPPERSNLPAFLAGAIDTNHNQSAYLDGEIRSSTPAYTEAGEFVDVQDSRSGYLSGSNSKTLSNSAFISGTSTDKSSISAYTYSGYVAKDSIPAYIFAHDHTVSAYTYAAYASKSSKSAFIPVDEYSDSFVKIVPFRSPLSTGTQDITDPNLSGENIVAVQLWLTSASSEDAESYPGFHSTGIGFTDGINEYATSGGSDATQDYPYGNQGWERSFDHCILLRHYLTTECSASFYSWLSNGVRINWDVVSSTDGFYGFAMFFCGKNAQAKVGFHSWPENDGETDDVNVGFEPHVLFALQNMDSQPTYYSRYGGVYNDGDFLYRDFDSNNDSGDDDIAPNWHVYTPDPTGQEGDCFGGWFHFGQVLDFLNPTYPEEYSTYMVNEAYMQFGYTGYVRKFLSNGFRVDGADDYVISHSEYAYLAINFGNDKYRFSLNLDWEDSEDPSEHPRCEVGTSSERTYYSKLSQWRVDPEVALLFPNYWNDGANGYMSVVNYGGRTNAVSTYDRGTTALYMPCCYGWVYFDDQEGYVYWYGYTSNLHTKTAEALFWRQYREGAWDNTSGNWRNAGRADYTMDLYHVDLTYSLALESFKDGVAELSTQYFKLPIIVYGKVNYHSEISCYVEGVLVAESSISAYMFCNTAVDSRHAFINAEGSRSIKSAYTRGKVSINNTRSAFLKGGEVVTSEVASYLDSQVDTSGSINAYLSGPSTSPKSSISAYMDVLGLWPFTDDFTGNDEDPWDQTKWLTEEKD